MVFTVVRTENIRSFVNCFTFSNSPIIKTEVPFNGDNTCKNLVRFFNTKLSLELFFDANRSIKALEQIANEKLTNVQNWLHANKLALNIKKSSFLIFYPVQQKLSFQVIISCNGEVFKQDHCIKYLSIMCDSHLNWKDHVKLVANKIKRDIGIISKIRLFVNETILINLYYTLIYPFLNYGITALGNTYSTALKPLLILQKRVLRLITFLEYREHTNPFFIKFNILKLQDLVSFNNALFVYNFSTGNLPNTFESFVTLIKNQHNYQTRLASKSSFALPKLRTNYGKFNIRFAGAKVWNSIDENIKDVPSSSIFKSKLKKHLLNSYLSN